MFFAAVLHVVLVDPRLDNGVDRAGFFAKAAVNTFEQVNVVARRAPGAVFALVGLDGDRQRRANGLAQLAGNAALLAVRVAAQRVQTTKTRRLRRFLFRVHDRERRAEKMAHRQAMPSNSSPARSGFVNIR